MEIRNSSVVTPKPSATARGVDLEPGLLVSSGSDIVSVCLGRDQSTFEMWLRQNHGPTVWRTAHHRTKLRLVFQNNLQSYAMA
ncbi:hypothetical protein RA28_01030 [Ruegeria sp. ANG-S4]|nr:hypothetical protein RA28_01030 [Ruegeria sp. ANG-S4]